MEKSSSKLDKKDGLYYPNKEFIEKANTNNPKIYQDAEKDPIKFWEKLAEEIFWFKKWDKAFEHKPPYFQWFINGKINITSNIFENNALGWEKIKNKKAVIWEGEPIDEKPVTLTYQELFEKVNKFANALKEIGVQKGDRVGIYLPVIPEVIISMLACARIGAVHSVVFSAYSPHGLQVRLQDTKAKVLITADGYYRRGKIINLKQNADEGIQNTDVEKIITVKRLSEEINIPWNKNRDFWYHELVQDQKKECQVEKMDAEDLFFILYTSGSTGKPKGCIHACGGYTVQAYQTGKNIFDFQENDIFWCTSDPGWITGHTYTIYSPLLNGITTYIFESVPDWPNSDRWCEIIEKYGITVFYTAPTAIRMFEKYGIDLNKYKFESLRLLGSVGEPIDESAWQFYFKDIGKEKCPILDTWWQTETGGILISSLPGIGPFKPSYTGIPFPGVKTDILDDKGNPVPQGTQGNLVILSPFSPGLFRGVYKNPEKYKNTYWSQLGDKIYFTSDGALKDENNLIRIIGRIDDVLKVAGHRLSTGELEDLVNSHPEITESATIGIPDDIKGEVPIIFISYKGKKREDEVKKDLIEKIKKEISPIALPKDIYFVDDLPKTRSGKIMRRILRKLFTQEDLGDLSTLANPDSVDHIKEKIKQLDIKNQKGISSVFLLDAIFVIGGIILLYFLLSQESGTLASIINSLIKK